MTAVVATTTPAPIRNRMAYQASVVFLVAAMLIFLGSVFLLGGEEQFKDIKLRLRNQHLERQMKLVEGKVSVARLPLLSRAALQRTHAAARPMWK